MLNSNAVKNFVLNKKNTLSENIFLCLAVTLTCAFFYYRGYSKWLSMLNKISGLLFVKPIGYIADSTGWGIYSLVLTLIAMVILAYVVGTNLSFFWRKEAKKSEYSDAESSENDEK